MTRAATSRVVTRRAAVSTSRVGSFDSRMSGRPESVESSLLETGVTSRFASAS